MLPTKFGFLWSLRARYKLVLPDLRTLNLHPSAGEKAQGEKDHEPVLSGGPHKH